MQTAINRHDFSRIAPSLKLMESLPRFPNTKMQFGHIYIQYAEETERSLY